MVVENNVFTVLEKAAREIEQQDDPGTFTTTEGVKFRLKKVPRTTFSKVLDKFEAPSPPTIWIEEKGRSEPNPNDPDFLKHMRDFDLESSLGLMMALVMLGSDVIDVPAGVERPEDTDWSETLEVIGFEIPAGGKARYAAWVRNVVLVDEENLTKMAAAISHFNGWIKVAEVQQVMNSFRSDEVRNSPPGISTPDEDSGWDRHTTG